MPEISKIVLPGSAQAYDIKDATARSLISGGVSFIIAWNGSSTPAVANIPYGVQVVYNSTTYTGTLAASSSTMGKFYLVKSSTLPSEDSLDIYDEYVTIENGSTYFWEKLGDTKANVSGMITDVTVAGTSVKSGNTAIIPKASSSDWGTVKVSFGGDPATRTLNITSAATESSFAPSGVASIPVINQNTDLISAYYLPEATTAFKGAMSATDKTKLDSALTSATLSKSTDSTHIILIPTSTDSVLGADTTFTLTRPTISAGATTRYLSASASGTAVGADGTVNAITAISGSVAVPTRTLNSSKLVTTSVPNVTNAGSASSWSFTMGNGTTYDTETLVIAGGNGSAPTLGTAITAATGSLATNGGGSSVITGYGSGSSVIDTAVSLTPTTTSVLTGVKVTSQPTITLNANTSSATGRITYVQASSPSLSGGSVTAGTNDLVTALTNSTDISTSTS